LTPSKWFVIMPHSTVSSVSWRKGWQILRFGCECLLLC